jgi:predicted peroxiredoxin
MSLLLHQSSLTDLFNLFLCNQGIKSVAKETEDKVKHPGVKVVKALRDDGVEGSLVSI